MLRQDLTSSNSHPNKRTHISEPLPEPPPQAGNALLRLDIQQSLNVLEELILESPRVPFSRRTLVDEDKLLDQLDRIRLNLPTAFREALAVVEQQAAILTEAEQYARSVVYEAEQEAMRRLDELGIVQRAEAQAQQVKQQLQQDCEALRVKTLAEMEQWQQASQQHWEQSKQQAEADCQAFKDEADTYAAQVLQRVEQQLLEMLNVVHNGRQSLQSADAAVPTEQRPIPVTSPRTNMLPQSDGKRSGRSRRQPG